MSAPRKRLSHQYEGNHTKRRKHALVVEVTASRAMGHKKVVWDLINLLSAATPDLHVKVKSLPMVLAHMRSQ